ncbi:hypothetical protein FOZ61_003412, partial [Perkinsus olseni]
SSSPSLKVIIRALQSGDVDQQKEFGRLRYVMKEGLLFELVHPHGNPLADARLVLKVADDGEEGRKLIIDLVTKYHGDNGHICPRFTRWRLSRHYKIDHLTKWVGKVCRECPQCQQGLIKRIFTTGGGHLDASAEGVWRHLSLDLAGPFCRSRPNNYTFALIVVDNFSKYTFWRGLRSATSSEVAITLLSLFEEVGLPVRVKHDNGSCFIGKPYLDAMKKVGVVVSHTTPFSPWANGLCERRVSSLKGLMRRLLNGKSAHWEPLLSKAMRKANVAPLVGATADCSPFEVFYGRQFVEAEARQLNLDTSPQLSTTYELDDARRELRDAYLEDLRARTYVPRPRRRPTPGSVVAVYRKNSTTGGTYGKEKFTLVGYEKDE